MTRPLTLFAILALIGTLIWCVGLPLHNQPKASPTPPKCPPYHIDTIFNYIEGYGKRDENMHVPLDELFKDGNNCLEIGRAHV